jgi:hypothetical protein
MRLCTYVYVSEQMPTIYLISITVADTANPINLDIARHAHSDVIR